MTLTATDPIRTRHGEPPARQVTPIPTHLHLVRPTAHPLRVLVADENHYGADSVAELLRLVGCDVATCYDGGSVLPLAEQYRPDACVLDLRMPALGGWAVGRRLREWAAGRPLLLVALTWLGGRGAEDASRDAGFDHILKPSDPRELSDGFLSFIRRMEPAVLQLV